MTVYYIRASNGAIKIGYTSKNVDQRLSALSTSSPLDLELVAQEYGTLSTEKQRHDQFKDNNIRNEWFKPSDELNKLIKQINPLYVPIPYNVEKVVTKVKTEYRDSEETLRELETLERQLDNALDDISSLKDKFDPYSRLHLKVILAVIWVGMMGVGIISTDIAINETYTTASMFGIMMVSFFFGGFVVTKIIGTNAGVKHEFVVDSELLHKNGHGWEVKV